MSIGVSISSTVSNVDANTDFSLVNVVTVTFYCRKFVGDLVFVCHIPNGINRQWTAALGTIKGVEPTLTAVVAVQIKVSLVNHTESGISFFLFKNAILQKISP